MFEIGITIGLTIVALLLSYLYLKHCQRLRSRSEREHPSEWNGKSFDAAPLMPAVENVRRDYLAARAPVLGGGFHRAFLRMARRGVARLAFFRDRRPEEDTHASPF